jgi:hypothetical protein
MPPAAAIAAGLISNCPRMYHGKKMSENVIATPRAHQRAIDPASTQRVT